MTYPPAGRPEEAARFLAEARAAVLAAGLDCPLVSSGGTPDMWRAHESEVVREYRPGTYIYLDRYQVAKGVGTADDCALTVLATVVSRPTPSRAVVDAGSKALTSDTLGMPDYGELVGIAGARLSGLSEEHGHVALEGDAAPRIGDRVKILPNHACVVSNLFDTVHLVSGEEVVDVLPVAARGRVG
jgi:D-serine deaminase-like pyridoxal phosphate-dependent protein